jgi:hypothetical protein
VRATLVGQDRGAEEGVEFRPKVGILPRFDLAVLRQVSDCIRNWIEGGGGGVQLYIK